MYVSEYIQESKINGGLIPHYKNDYYIENITKRFKNIFRIKNYISSLISIMLDDNSFESYKDFLQNSNSFNFVPDSNFKIRLNDKDYEYDLFFFGSLNSFRNHEIAKLQKKYKVYFSNIFLTNEQRSFFLKNSSAALHLSVGKKKMLTSPLRVYFAALCGKYTISNYSCPYTKDFIRNISDISFNFSNVNARFDRHKQNEFSDYIKFIKQI